MESLIDVHLHRHCVVDSWGFSMAGGLEQHRPLTITKVFRSTPAEAKLEEGEVIVKINESPTNKLYHREAVNLIQRSGPYLKLSISRRYMTKYAEVAKQSLGVSNPFTVQPWTLPPSQPEVARTSTLSPTPHEMGVFRGAPEAPAPPVPPMSSLGRALSGYRPPPSYFYSTPDVAIAGTPEAAVRTVEVNLARHKPVLPKPSKPKSFNTKVKKFYKEGGDFGATVMVKY